MDTTIPTGISNGENKFLATVSAKIKIIPLMQADIKSIIRWLEPKIFFAICGPNSPKNAILPATDVASPANIADNAKNMIISLPSIDEQNRIAETYYSSPSPITSRVRLLNKTTKIKRKMSGAVTAI